MKKYLSLLLIAIMSMTILIGCSNDEGAEADEQVGSNDVVAEDDGEEDKEEDADSSSEPVSISFYTTETGKDEAFQDIIAGFEEENPNISVEYIAAGNDQLQKWMALYASNEGPTVSLMDPINIYENQERMRPYDPEVDTWLSNVVESSLSTYTFDGDVYGIPMSAAGFGLLYNQRVLDEAVGGEFDPATIKTRQDLEDLFISIEETGVAASMFTGVDWSIGSHFLGLVYSEYRGDVPTREEFVAEAKAGNTSLIEDSVFNDYMDTFDLIAEYNYNKEDPLIGNVNMDADAFAKGEVATWFMGDWAWTYIADIEDRDSEFGILPVPVNDDENDPINSMIPSSYAKGYCVDTSQNTVEQQEAGVKFVEYISSNENAHQIMSQATGQALPFKNNTATNDSPFGKATAEYIDSGNTFDFYGTANMLPSDFWYDNGAYMCAYLAGEIDRPTLAESIDSYWIGQE